MSPEGRFNVGENAALVMNHQRHSAPATPRRTAPCFKQIRASEAAALPGPARKQVSVN